MNGPVIVPGYPKIAPRLFTSLNQVRTDSPKPTGTKFKIVRINCFKYSPNKHIFSYLEPTYSAYPVKLYHVEPSSTHR